MSHGDLLLTGASGVIGTAIARRLAAAGYTLHVTSRKPAKLKPLAKELLTSGARVHIYPLDLAKRKTIDQLTTAFFRNAKKPLGLIGGAGHMGELGQMMDARFDAWLQTVDENFTAQAVLIRSFLLAYRKKRLTQGRIILFSGAGLGGDGPYSHMSAYGSAKAALTHLVEALAGEIAPLGITINAIAPGQVLSTITKQVLKAGDKAGHLKALAERCMQTGGTSPDLAAQLVEYLLSPQAAGITGRLLSARFDQNRLRENPGSVAAEASLYRLRRIDDDLYARKNPKP